MIEGVKLLSLAFITTPPATGNPPTHLLVALHGWGANQEDLTFMASALNLPGYQFFFPDAPFPHSQVPGGRAWYALERMDEEGFLESRQRLLTWLLSLEEETGVPLSRTILSGFSQGGGMTLEVGLSLPLAGLCVLSGFLPRDPQPQASVFPPVLMVHGRQDPVIPLREAQQARDRLLALGVQVAYQTFDMGHTIDLPALALMESFIKKVNQSA